MYVRTYVAIIYPELCMYVHKEYLRYAISATYVRIKAIKDSIVNYILLDLFYLRMYVYCIVGFICKVQFL